MAYSLGITLPLMKIIIEQRINMHRTFLGQKKGQNIRMFSKSHTQIHKR